MKRTQIFEAADGRTFATAEECREHEDRAFVTLLEGLSNDAVADALDRRNTELSDAFERAGNIISVRRRASGELRKKRKTKQAAALADKTGEKAGKLLADKLDKRRRTAALI
jgi:hypothetical protein